MNLRKKVKILIVDDHHVVVQGIKSVLDLEPEFEVVGEALNGKEAIQLAASLAPDIVIMDISMPETDGIKFIRQIKKKHPGIQIVVYSIYSDKEFVIRLFKTGISAYVLKEDPLSDLIITLNAVKAGGTYFSTMAPTILIRHMEELEQKYIADDPFESLSRREKEVFILLAQGKRIREIADELFISPKTVETHKYHIMEKLDASSVVDLTKFAIREKLIKV